MRQFSLIFFLLSSTSAFSQYYLRGELKDEQGQGLADARITLSSKGNYPYYTGSSGAFGIPTSLKIDTITFTLEGYDTLKTAVVTTEYGKFTLKMSPRKVTVRTLHLSSLTKNLQPDLKESNTYDGESYSPTIENPFVTTKDFPETGFAVHVDGASYSNIRRFLKSKKKPPADAVRIEEMLNYFNLKTKAASNTEKTFSVNTNLTSCPWNLQNQLLFINLKARKIRLNNSPSANLVFLIDVSGSMDADNRLPLLKSAFKLLVENLRSVDVVSIVTYGDKATRVLEPTHGNNKQQIIEAIEGLTPAGATAGASAIRIAYKIARENFIPHGNNRVILATDGDFNIGETSEKDLEDIISKESKTGIYLTCLGVGIGNYKDSKLEALANKGNGNFAYLDNEKEAEKVLVEEFAQTLYSVADNVHLTVRFNPDVVKTYRLIGFDNKKSAITDSSTTLEGGEIGSGHSLLAAFEINRADSGRSGNSSLAIGTAILSYKIPGNNTSINEEYKIPQNYLALEKSDSSLQFATSVIMLGTVLKESPYAKQFSWNEIYSLAINAADPHNRLQMEFVDLIAKAKKLYRLPKKRKH
ncbi:YfbK domain-containing protein [Segetibacter koreensis]|uniref:YfbK domain-containing protein n=1 Tax=Segetibacter koreensis TaxID=398037 RepID=UPI00035EAB17|nr:von Willebrand factor type A domain-containing protein [Segetibacter koreensis]